MVCIGSTLRGVLAGATCVNGTPAAAGITTKPPELSESSVVPFLLFCFASA